MDLLSIYCVLLGGFIVAGRGPLLFAPRATLHAYERLVFSTDNRFRTLAVFVATLATSAILLPLGEGAPTGLIRALGWVVAVAALGGLVQPGPCRRFARGTLSFTEHRVGDAILRMLGFLAALVGAVLIYLGIYVV